MEQPTLIAMNVFVAIFGAMIVPLVPIGYLSKLDTIPGRFLLLSLPVLAYHLLAPQLGVMVGVVVAIIIDRIHDLAITPDHSFKNGSGSGGGSGNAKREHEVLLDLSPDYTQEKSDEIVMLEPIDVRRKHGVK